jgi:hypothetical protein
LKLEQGLGALGAEGEGLDVLAHRGDPFVALGAFDGLGATLPGGEPGDGAPLAQLAPEGQMGGVEPLPTEQRSDRAGGLAGVGLPQNLELVLRGELPPRGLCLDLRRRVTRSLLLVHRHRQNLGRPAQSSSGGRLSHLHWHRRPGASTGEERVAHAPFVRERLYVHVCDGCVG